MSNYLALEALTDFLNAVEARIVAARQRIKADKALWDPNKNEWTRVNGYYRAAASYNFPLDNRLDIVLAGNFK